MPFTPFHLGPALLIGLLLFSFLDLPTFIIANVIIDMEPFAVILFNLNYPLHGYFHSYLAGTFIAAILAIFMFLMRRYIQIVMKLFKIYQESSFKKIFLSSLFGIYLHITLDSTMYLDIKPFYPFDFNPLYNIVGGFEIYFICVICFILGIFLYFYKILK